jgi:hypothetical protein
MIFVKARVQGARDNDRESAVFQIAVDAALNAAIDAVMDKTNLLWPLSPMFNAVGTELVRGKMLFHWI